MSMALVVFGAPISLLVVDMQGQQASSQRNNGAIFVDKCGTIDAGSDKFDVVYDSSASGSFQAFATPTLAKNTFRIIPNG
jgi:hypothetical protein